MSKSKEEGGADIEDAVVETNEDEVGERVLVTYQENVYNVL